MRGRQMGSLSLEGKPLAVLAPPLCWPGGGAFLWFWGCMLLCLAIRLDIRLDVPPLLPDTPDAPGKKKINTRVRHTPANAGNTSSG